MKTSDLVPSEHAEQCAVIAWADLQAYDNEHKIGAFLFAIPNGGQRNKITAARLKAEGVRAGVPDLFLAIPRAPYSGLFIEMKRSKKSLSKVSKEQREKQELFERMGYKVVVCYGADEAFYEIKTYLNIR